MSTVDGSGVRGKAWWGSTALVIGLALLATVPTTGDIGLTWDEPAYRFSQLRTEQWWRRLGDALAGRDRLGEVLSSDTLLYYWVYARHGINFHPPLAGQLSSLAHAIFSGWMREMPARRMASILEYVLAIGLLHGFLARRYGRAVGAIAAGALLFMPRVYGDGHIAGTDTPGLLLWPAAALAFWKGLNEPRGGRWRVACGVLLGLSFVEKMGTFLVFVPLLAWLGLSRLRLLRGGLTRGDLIDGGLTLGAMGLPLGLALAEILRLARTFPPPRFTDMFLARPQSPVPDFVLALPLLIWLTRRLVGRLRPRGPIWGVERPALETITSALAFVPVLAWLGNPAWWRETLPRLAHYYLINTDRRGSLPDIQVFYLGQIYEYSLPWHNGWVLMGVTVPAAILGASLLGVGYTLRNLGRDRLPLYFLMHCATLPLFRMLPTPCHDGVRLFLPAFFFLAGLAGWGAVAGADLTGRVIRARRAWVPRLAAATLVLVPSAWQLVKTHPYELSYYNELIGGPRGAWTRGLFELTYWYDAFNPPVLADLADKLPRDAVIDFLNEKTNPMTFGDLQALGDIRGDVRLGVRDVKDFPHVWMLTQDSKATAFTRLLFAMRPWYESRPARLDGLRAAGVAEPSAVGRAWALALLVDAEDDLPPARDVAPDWVHECAPFLGRFWGEGLVRVSRPTPNRSMFEWARTDPEGLRAAARALAARPEAPTDPAAIRLRSVLDRYANRGIAGFALRVLNQRPERVVEAVDILTRRPDDVLRVLTRYAYTDPAEIGDPLDDPIQPTSTSSSVATGLETRVQGQIHAARPSAPTATSAPAQ